MGNNLSKLLFDKRDHELIQIVNDALSADRRGKFIRKVYFPHLHPHGIKEMTETKGLRTAYAVAQLLSSLEVGGVDDRINALRSLRHEVIDTAEGPLAKNTARVLLQIMKDLVRAHGDYRQAAGAGARISPDGFGQTAHCASAAATIPPAGNA